MMSRLGDVVFCVDCDRARWSSQEAATADSAEPLVAPPRRMAIKKDANGDPLCPSCLDSRQAKRRAEFMLHEERATTAALQPSPPVATAPAPRKKVEFVRIVRTRPQPEEAAPAPRRKRAAPRVATRPVVQKPASSARNRAAERKFALLILEVGFLRTQELLDALKAAARRKAR